MRVHGKTWSRYQEPYARRTQPEGCGDPTLSTSTRTRAALIDSGREGGKTRIAASLGGAECQPIAVYRCACATRHAGERSFRDWRRCPGLEQSSSTRLDARSMKSGMYRNQISP